LPRPKKNVTNFSPWETSIAIKQIVNEKGQFSPIHPSQEFRDGA
jgi:hypothetical protein